MVTLDELIECLQGANESRLRYLQVHEERDALRAERVQLQAENESLRNDLARMPAGGPKLDDRDRELLTLAAGIVFGESLSDETSAVYRLLCRLAEQPVEADEHARMEDEGGPTPAEPDRAGWYGAWVKGPEVKVVSPEVQVGSKVRVRPGTKTLGGTYLDAGRSMTVLELGLRKRDGHEYTVNVGYEPSRYPGWWIKPDDIAEVLT